MNRRDREPDPQPWDGFPQTADSALTPVGEIEQARKVAEGFRQTRDGWRRAVFLIGVVVVALSAAFVVFAGFYGAAHP
ncbi:hypothetical protein ACWKSP_04725 [Micromonosporaceae bacterium Da 78-11]